MQPAKEIEPMVYDEAGMCAKCGEADLAYGERDFNGDGMVIPYVCNDCKHIGEEHYSVQWIQTV